MFFKKYFTFKQLQRKLKGLEPKKECAYIIDGFAYTYDKDRDLFHKVDNEKMSIEQIYDLVKIGDKVNMSTIVCFTKRNRHRLTHEYLEYCNSKGDCVQEELN